MKTLVFTVLFLAVSVAMFGQQLVHPYYLTRYTYSDNSQYVLLKRCDGERCTIESLGNKGKRFFTYRGDTLLFRQNLLDRLMKHEWTDVDLIVRSKDGSRETVAFRLVRDEFIKNRVIAHRGYWNESVPRNSMAAFKRSLDLGIQGTEFDIHLTKDDRLIVNHDGDYNGVVLRHTNLADLRKLTLPNGEALPTFEEFLSEGMKQNRTQFVIELKSDEKSEVYARKYVVTMLNEIKRHKAQAWASYITFDINLLKELLRYEPETSIGYLNGDLSAAELKGLGCKIMSYRKSLWKEKPQLTDECEKAGVAPYVWTVNAGQEMDWFIERRFEGITSDHPDLLLEKIKSVAR